MKNSKTKICMIAFVLIMSVFTFGNNLTVMNAIEQDLAEENLIVKEDFNITNNQSELMHESDENNEFKNEIIEPITIIKENKDNQEIENDDQQTKMTEFLEEGFIYVILTDNTIRINKYIGDTSKEIIIPQRINSYVVSELGDGINPIFASNNYLGNIVVEAENVIINAQAFEGLKLNRNSLIFKNNIAQIGDKAFLGLEAEELILPSDMRDIYVGENIFGGAFIIHFTVPYNFKTADTRRVAHWNLFRIVTIKEPLDKSVAYSIGYTDADANTDLVIQNGVREMSNIGLENIKVNNIYIPSSMKKMSDDVFKGIKITRNIVFNEVSSFEQINLVEIINQSQVINDVKVHIPHGVFASKPQIDSIKLKEYNDCRITIEGNGLDTGMIYPTIDDYYDSLIIDANFTNINSVMSSILPSNDFATFSKFIMTEEPSQIKNIKVEIPKYLTGEDPTHKIPLNIIDVSSDKDIDVEILENKENNVVIVDNEMSDMRLSIILSVGYDKETNIEDLYSGDFKFKGTIINNQINTLSEISRDILLENLEYQEADLSYNTINYHSLKMEDLLSLHEVYDELTNYDLETILFGLYDEESLEKINVFYETAFLNDMNAINGMEDSGYAYFKYDLNKNIQEKYSEPLEPTYFNSNIKSEGVSLLMPDDNNEVILEDTDYDFIDSDEIVFDAQKDDESLKYIVLGDKQIFKNAKQYFKGENIEPLNFKVIPYNGGSLKIKDYVDEFTIITPNMLLIYGDNEEIPQQSEKIEISVHKVWDDNHNISHKRPQSVEVMLIKNNEETDTFITLDASNNWTQTFTNLDKEEDGEIINYQIKEINIDENYTSEISGNQDIGYTVTNHLNETSLIIPDETPTVDEKPIIETNKPKEEIDPSNKTPDEKISLDSKDAEMKIPETSVDSMYIKWMILLIISISTYYVSKKKKIRDQKM